MRVDRHRFLALTAALAAACGAPAPAAPAPVAPLLDVPAGATAPATPPLLPDGSPAAAPSPPPLAASTPANEECAQEDVGSLAVCDQLNLAPTCEDAAYAPMACRQLAERYRPAIAERIATCEQKAGKGRRCPRNADLAACHRHALDNVCLRESARAKCADMIANCTRRTQRVRYTLDQCTRIISAAAPSHVHDLVYTMGGIDAQGAPWNEGCWID